LRGGVFAIVVLGAAACGTGTAERGTGQTVRLDAAADGSLAFERDSTSARAGRISFVMNNPSNIPHALGVRGKGVEQVGETVAGEGTSRFEVELEPGDFELFCPVGGHELAGMTAQLTVR